MSNLAFDEETRATAPNKMHVQVLLNLVTAGELMREKQNRYFRTRDRGVMQESIVAEAAFDKALSSAKAVLG